MKTSDIFISYSRKDLEKAKEIVADIQKHVGITPWFDLEGVETGAKFANVIAEKISACVVFVLLYSTRSRESEWVQRELEFALDEHKRVCPLLIEDDVVMLPGHKFLLSGMDRIVYSNADQRAKFFRDLQRWCNISESVSTEAPEPDHGPTPEDLFQKAEELLRDASFSEEGVTPKSIEAVKYLRMAAERGYAQSQLALGMLMLEGGLGIEQNTDEGLSLISHAAEGGDSKAMVILGDLYLSDGEYFPQDEHKAEELYRQAAKAGSLEAMIHLSAMMEDIGNDQDAIQWLRNAVAAGSADACLEMGDIYNEGRCSLSEDKSRAKYYYRKAIELKSDFGYCKLGQLAMEEEDFPEALFNFKKAAESEWPSAMLDYARCLMRGVGCAPDLDEAERWLLKLSDAFPNDDTCQELVDDGLQELKTLRNPAEPEPVIKKSAPRSFLDRLGDAIESFLD